MGKNPARERATSLAGPASRVPLSRLREPAPCAIPCYHTRMGNIPVEFSLEQLQAIVILANNQLFRVKYIDPKMPGHVNRPEQLEIFKQAVGVVEAALNKAKGIKDRNA